MTINAHVIVSSALLLASCASDPEGKPSAKPMDGGGGAWFETGTSIESGKDPTEASSVDQFVPPLDVASFDSEPMDASSVADVSGSDARADDARTIDGRVVDASTTDVRTTDARADVVAADATTPLPGCDAATWHARADESLDRLWSGFWNASSRYFDASEPSNGNVTGYWTFAEAFDAMLDGVERTGGRKYFANIATLYAAQNARGWSNYYYDDESWMVLTLTRAFDLTGERTYLDQAVTLYRDIIAGWDSTGVAPGGIWWNKGKGQKATASNGGPVISGARLAARTGDASHLAFARQVYDFWFMKMVNPTTYEVADHLSPTGVVSWGRLTYNEGVMIGAAQALYLATGEARFLTHAHGFAHSLIASKAVTTSAGSVLTDGTNTSCVGDCPQWKGIGYRYLAGLFKQEPRAEYRTVVEGCAQGAWTLARTASTGYFANDWRGPPTSSASVEGQSSSATAINLYASLCGPYRGD